ncbi:MAG: TetR/AcrR family transcriptional regulator [Anaerovibrio sp.]|uniref:TetR/AcrR family transcriptional regulator n=1 Tax=Anaerovibrio sp. TaxID=1872532 RepID=UPI0025FB8B72|nr:TetR/AcrR family transcriptional regulator [Anaerovibrio sp.]MCR5176244.1 TetR/AcrR family transcriptional regulator [Anaerovibrio sp.]
MTRIRKNPAERRQEFMDRSMELFCTKGYEQTMVQDICRAVGVAKGTFFYYFPTKEDVLKAIFANWVKQFEEDFIYKAKGMTAAEQLKLFLNMSSQDNAIEPLVDKLMEEGQWDMVRNLWQLVLEQSFNPLMLRILAKGKQEGSMQVDYQAESLDFFWNLMDVVWPIEQQANSADENVSVREAIAAKLIESLFGMKPGSLAHFGDTV